MTKSIISSKGQITVPTKIREALGMTPGTVIHFEVREGGAFMKKGYRGEHPVDRAYGRLDVNRPVDEIVDEMRGPRPARRRHGPAVSADRGSMKRGGGRRKT